MQTTTKTNTYGDNKTDKTRHAPQVQAVLDKMEKEFAIKHFRRSTRRSYRNYAIKYMYYRLQKKDHLADEAAVKDYLSYMATVEKVSSSTQNVAFNALRFLYITVLERPLGEINATRAKQYRRIPTVFTREEVSAFLAKTYGVYEIILSLLYGCGLRIRVDCLTLYSATARAASPVPSASPSASSRN